MNLFLTTEETGIPSDYNAPISDSANWPEIIQFSYILSSKKGQVIEEGSFLIKPNKKPHSAIITITGISNNMLNIYGINFKEAFVRIERLFLIANTIISFNIQYRLSLIRAEYFRINGEDLIINNSLFDLGIKTINLCQLPSHRKKGEYRLPKLEDIHLALYNIDLKELHSVDKLKTAKKCFHKLPSKYKKY